VSEPKQGLLAHQVFFKLKDNSPEAREKMLADCEKFLKPHAGIVFFAVGTVCDELKRPVNDRDWDVALHIIFTDKAAHDVYQDTEAHNAFIAANKENWAGVRVFDSIVRR